MAQDRISLWDAAAPLSGSENIPMIQEGRNVRIQVQNFKTFTDTSCQCTLVSRYDTVGTDADTKIKYLQTYSMPPNTLDTNGSWIEIYAWGLLNSPGNQKTLYLYFGSALSSTGIFTGGSYWYFYTKILRTSANTQKIFSEYNVPGVVSGADVGASLTEDLTSQVQISIAGKNNSASANDVVCHSLIVRVNKVDVES